MTNEDVRLLSLLTGPCPHCGNGSLRATSDGELTNFLCLRCGACWHAELAWVKRIDPTSCPGCQYRGLCRPDPRLEAVATPTA